MSLSTYRKKRNFGKTPEPKGKMARREEGRSFVVQKHDASRLHYDFRLELDGVLKSWAVPKGPSLDPSRKVLAVQVEDHPLEYGNFEGTIPQGQDGGGTVMLWDRGTWEPLHDPAEGLRAGKLHFVLHGKKLKGEWSLVRMKPRGGEADKNWLLMKLKDEYSGKADILEKAASVKSKRSMDQIATKSRRVWNSGRNGSTSNSRHRAVTPDFTPQLAVLVDHPPEGDRWVHEIKFDGYRILATLEGSNVRLFTRNLKDWTDRFPKVAAALEKLDAKSTIIDGEIVVLDDKGRSDFQGLQRLLKKEIRAEPIFYAFDLPRLRGKDLRQQPLLERKQELEKLLRERDISARVRLSDHVRGSGEKVVEKACRMELEGIISKRIDAPYVSRRDPTWVKSKCQQRQEFLIIGYTDPQRSRTGFGAMLLGYHDDQKRLAYAGKVGTGFDNRQLREMLATMKKLDRDQSPLDGKAKGVGHGGVHWIEPKLVAEVRFTGWTRDGRLRHPAFIALRSDKPPEQIVREKPVPAEEVTKMKPTAQRAIAGVELSHPDKVLYPESRRTKQDLADYYESVATRMLPYVIDRPLALVRCPGGMGGKCFFQRNWSDSLPPGIGKVNVSDSRTREEHVMIHDLAGLISLVQIGVLEIHTWNCRSDDIEHPDQLIFDLDPGPDVPWKRVIETARKLHRILEHSGLPTFLKTSGGKGLHLTIPIEPTIDWDAGKRFCEAIVKSMARESDEIVANMRKDLRKGKIYIDYHRNGRSATAVAPYSTRAREGAPVSMPISWEEIAKLTSAAQFTVETASRQLKKRKADPWRRFEQSRIDLRRLLAHKSAA